MKDYRIVRFLMILLSAVLALACLGMPATAEEAGITTWEELQEAVSAGGTVTLTKNVQAVEGDIELTIPAGKTVILDLKGHDLTGPQGSGAIINKGTLTIQSSGNGAVGTIIGRNTSAASDTGVVLNSGTLTLEGGNITNYPHTTTVENLSAGVYVSSGTFTMAGGRISNCPGYGVRVINGSFAMSDGTITKNGKDGVHLSKGTFTLTDGTISENNGNGVFAADAFTMSNAQISGNAGNGVYVKAGVTFTMNSGSILLNGENGVELSDGTDAQMLMIDGIIQGNEGYGIQVNPGNTVKMDGGIITANERHGIYINQGDFTNVGGYITDNAGDGVYLNGGTFDMVTGSVMANHQNGVYVNAGSFAMQSGFISENGQNGIQYGSGSGTASAVITGGTIGENTGYGVNILADGFKMNGGTVKGNASYGVHAGANVAFEICGGTIKENDGGVSLEKGSQFKLSGNPVISGNTTVVNWTPVPCNADLRGGKKITISGALSAEACVGVSTDTTGTLVFTSGLNGKGAAENFFSDDSRLGVSLNDNGEAKIIEAFTALQARIDAAPNGATIRLLSDVIAQPGEAGLLVTFKGITLDLNGHTLNRNLSQTGGDEGSVIRVESGASLRITDSSAFHMGMITGGFATDGGGIYNAGTLTLDGGTVFGNKATNRGGGVYTAPSATLNASGTA